MIKARLLLKSSIFAFAMVVLIASSGVAATAKKKPTVVKKAKPAVVAPAVTKEQFKALEEKVSTVSSRSEESAKKLDKKIDTSVSELNKKIDDESAVLNERLDARSGSNGLLYALIAIVIAGFAVVVFILRRLVSKAVAKEVELRVSEIRASGDSHAESYSSETPAYMRRRSMVPGRETVGSPEDDVTTEHDETPAVEQAAKPAPKEEAGFTKAQKTVAAPAKPAQGDLFSGDNHYEQGLAEHKKNSFDEAIANYTCAIEADGNFAPAYNHRGLAYAEKKDYARAIEDFGKAIMLDNRDSKTYLNIIEVLTVVGEFARALEILQKGRPFILGAEDVSVAAFWECVLKKLSGEDVLESENKFLASLEEDFIPTEWTLRLVPAWLESSNMEADKKDFIQSSLEKLRAKA